MLAVILIVLYAILGAGYASAAMGYFNKHDRIDSAYMVVWVVVAIFWPTHLFYVLFYRLLEGTSK